MKYQPNRDYVSNDVVQTPPSLCKAIVEHFKPQGTILEPCKGEGNFLACMPTAEWCEISEGRDFFQWDKKVDWIVTNFPWSDIRKCMLHGMKYSKNIVSLTTVNHSWTKARLRDLEENNFGIKEIGMVATPKEFPQSGFQLAALHFKKGFRGRIKLSKINY